MVTLIILVVVDDVKGLGHSRRKPYFDHKANYDFSSIGLEYSGFVIAIAGQDRSTVEAAWRKVRQ